MIKVEVKRKPELDIADLTLELQAVRRDLAVAEGNLRTVNDNVVELAVDLSNTRDALRLLREVHNNLKDTAHERLATVLKQNEELDVYRLDLEEAEDDIDQLLVEKRASTARESCLQDCLVQAWERGDRYFRKGILIGICVSLGVAVTVQLAWYAVPV